MTDDELIETCRDFRNGLLGEGKCSVGMCAAVSWPLAAFLRSLCGIDAECVESDLSDHSESAFYKHVWIRLPDGRVLDPTFDQFCSEELSDIYLGKPTEFHVSPTRKG